MPRRAQLHRRTFLASLASGGLVLTVGPAGVRKLEALTNTRAKLKADPLAPNVYLSIADTGLITVICHRSEMGQGSTTTLVMILADELEADWTKIRYEQAIGDAKYGDQNTDGSSSIRGGVYEKFRTAGATARVMLEQAAAAQWGVPVSEVAARNSRVTHAKTRRVLAYGALVARARTLDVPKTPALKDPKAFRFIGKRVKPIQQRAMVTGKGVYGQDVTLPGMKVAVIARPPVLGSKVATVDSTQALRSPGVERIVDIPAGPATAYGFTPLGGVAVIAKDTWSAIAGRNKLVITWTDSPHASYGSVAYRAELEASARAPD
jgi:isoquinoline 1-oxidoreductase beta subunit